MTQLRAPHDRRTDIRNIAIIAHVDHGKTTLVDAVLRQTHVHRKIDDMGERIMDSMDQERERGITIRAKNASVVYKGVKINIVDTPGHADFGGEVERTLRMVDGVLILIDAKEGPMPQTTFVLRKALALGHKAIVVINKIDRPDAVIDDVVNRTFDLFVHLGATDEQLDFPIVYAAAIKGQATLDVNKPGTDITPLLDTVLEKIPAPAINAEAPLQILVLALVQDPYKGKMGIGKIQSGSIARRQPVMLLGKDGAQTLGKVSDLAVYSGLERVDADQAAAGEIVAVAGLDAVSIGDTIADAENPIALPRVTIDEPTVQMSFSVNNSPFAGREGKYLTSRHLRDRLFKELETNVSLRNLLLAKTRGTIIMHHVFAAYEPAEERDLMVAPHGSLVAHEDGSSTGYAIFMTQERGTMFIGPGVEVYRGMVIGENSRDEDLDVNVCKEKHLSNMRASGTDEALVLTPPREMSLEFALEYIGPDELVEITPLNLRLRKRLLNADERRRAKKAGK
ncbi:hypothetical protein B566_EDAN000271 [Ephemera danica]|nr:hypothetical protein B566_EDAN000271 [Ephemera danica]